MKAPGGEANAKSGTNGSRGATKGNRVVVPTIIDESAKDFDLLGVVSVSARLHESILSRQARCGVLGLGYVGLPLAVAFAEAGFKVLGFDVDAERVATVNAGKSHIPDVSVASLERLVRDGLLRATDDQNRLAEVDIINICVPTPLGKTRDPDISHVVAATEQVARSLRRGQLVILESTTYPGTTRDVILPRLEATGLSAGEDFFLAFSPERIDPGNPRFGIKNTPKVVGGLDAPSGELAVLLYRQVVETVVPVASPESAEMVKLLENTFRSVNIALANETALMCDRLNLDVWEIIEATATKPFGFMPFFPGPGIGGHCIPLDPYYLSWKMKALDYRARFIELAAEINAEMPHHVVAKVTAGLNEREQSVKGSDILILGVAYKANVADVRESPALDIIGLLQHLGARVSYSDPHVPSVETPRGLMMSEPITADRLARADCVIVVTDHRAFDYDLVARCAHVIVDTRNSIKARPNGGAVLIKL